MPINAATVVATLNLDTSKFTSGLESAKAQLRSFASDTMTTAEKFKTLSSVAQGLGRTLNYTVTAPLVGAGAAAVKTFTGFDDAMRQVRATMNATADETEALTQAAKDAGATTRYSASEAAAALNYLALAGYDSTTAIAALPDVLRLAQAGGMELAYTSDLLTDSMSALGKSSDYMSTFADQMTRASQRSNTSIAQLGEGILQVGGLAKNLAGDTVELNTVLGVLADNGIKGAEGGTHLRNILLALTAPEKQGAEALKALGVSAVDSTGKLRPLSDVFADLNKAMSSMTDAERTQAIADIFRTTDIASVNALLATSADRWTELGAAITDSSGAAKNAADTMEGGIGGAFRSMKSAVEAAAVEFGENLAPMVQSAAEWVTGLARSFAGLSENTQNMILRVAAFAAAAGPALIVLGKLTTAAGTLMKLFSGPAGWVMLGVGAVGALAIAIAKARSEMDGFHNAANKALANVDDERVDRLTQTIEVDTSVIGINGKSVFDQLQEQLPSIYDAIANTLTDGKPDDAATMAALEGDVRAYYSGLRGEVEAWAEAELAKLDVNSATYEQDAENIRNSAAKMTDELNDLETQSVTWMDENAGRSTQAVQAHMGELDAIEAKAATVLQTIRATTVSWNDLEERNLERVKAGTATSDEAVAMALDTLQDRAGKAIEAATTTKAEQMAELMESELQGEDYTRREREIAEASDADVQGIQDAVEAEALEIIRGQSGLTEEDWGNLAVRNEAAALHDIIYNEDIEGDEKRAAVEGMSDALDALIREYAPDASPGDDTWLRAVADALDEIVGAKEKDLGQIDLTNAAEIFTAVEKRGLIDAGTTFEDAMGDIAQTMTTAVEEAAEAVATRKPAERPLLYERPERQTQPQSTPNRTAPAASDEKEIKQGLEEKTTDAIRQWAALNRVKMEAEQLLNNPDFSFTTDETAAYEAMSQELKDFIGQISGQNVDEYTAGNEEYGTWIFDRLLEAYTTASDQLDAMDATDLQESTEDLFSSVGEASADGFVAGMEKGTADVQTANKDMIEAGLEAAEEAAEINSPSRKYRQIGIYTVEGLILGLEDKRADLLRKARELATETAATVREALDIHSPSKLFRGFGRNTAEGFALGIDDGMFRTEQALSRLTGFSPAAAGAGAGGPVINVTLPNATVRSDEDARNIARNIASYINKVNRGYGG